MLIAGYGFSNCLSQKDPSAAECEWTVRAASPLHSRSRKGNARAAPEDLFGAMQTAHLGTRNTLHYGQASMLIYCWLTAIVASQDKCEFIPPRPSSPIKPLLLQHSATLPPALKLLISTLALNKDPNTSDCATWMVITFSMSYTTHLWFLRSWKQRAGIYGRRHLHMPGSLPLPARAFPEAQKQLHTFVLCKRHKPSSFLSKSQGWKPKVWHLCFIQLPPLLCENLSVCLGNPHCTLLFGGYCRKLTSATRTGRRKIFVYKEY